MILPSLCSSWRVVRRSVLAKGLLKGPGGWGWAGPGAPWRGLGLELQPFYALCVPGSHFHFYRKGFLLPFTKLVFSCLIRERVRHTMSSKTRMWRQVQRRDRARACLAGRFPELSLRRALLAVQGPAPWTSPGSGHGGLACPAGLRPWLHPCYRLVPQRASPLKRKL